MGKKRCQERELVVLSAPSGGKRSYYCRKHSWKTYLDILEFEASLANAIIDFDDVLILADLQAFQYLEKKVPQDVLCVCPQPVEDIWIRDFGPINGVVFFEYSPDYGKMKHGEARFIQASLKSLFERNGLCFEHANYILDGGNFVHNGNGIAIVSEKFLEQNSFPSASEEGLRALMDVLGLKHVVAIPYDLEDPTGHADGLLFFGDENTLFINEDPEELFVEIRKRIKGALGDSVRLVRLPVRLNDSSECADGLPSACGIYANSLVTKRAVYVPTYNIPEDERAIDIIRKHTKKHVVRVDASKVCGLGGRLRCLTWQVSGKYAKAINQAFSPLNKT